MGFTETRMKMPLIIHDLHDSQMFAIAQAAGRAGIPVEGTFWPLEKWGVNSRYIQRAEEFPCLSEQLKGRYALGLKSLGLSGVWLPCVDDMAEFTAGYQAMLRNIGMHFITTDAENIMRAFATEMLPETTILKHADVEIARIGDMYEQAERYHYPLIIKSARNHFRKMASSAELKAFLERDGLEESRDQYHKIQSYIEGDVEQMASAIILFDEESRPVRGFTGRRYQVADTRYGPFGETTVARAEWIPELYEGAAELLSNMQWKGFAEVECKQGRDGHWYIMEVNPRLSGWSCLAEADGAGLLSAYYQICSEGVRLEEACLQRSASEYIRTVATCYHDPEWAIKREGNGSFLSGLWRLAQVFSLYRMRRPQLLLGAWDERDLKASLAILWSSIRRVWKNRAFRKSRLRRRA